MTKLHPGVLYGRLATSLGHERYHPLDRENREMMDLQGLIEGKKWGKEGDRKRIERREQEIISLYDGHDAIDAQATRAKTQWTWSVCMPVSGHSN